MEPTVIIGFLFLVIGGFFVVRPDLIVKSQIWIHSFLDITYVPGERTNRLMRIFGIPFIIIGLLVLVGTFGR